MLRTVGITLLLGSIAGYLLGGKLSGLSRVKIRGLPFVYASLICGLLPLVVSLSGAAPRTLISIAYALLLVFLVMSVVSNAGIVRLGFLVIALGWLLNTAAITLNGGMPLSLHAYQASGQTDAVTAGEGGFFKIIIANSDSRVRFLGDVIPIRPLRSVLSLGDILLSVGVGVVIAGGMVVGEPINVRSIAAKRTN